MPTLISASFAYTGVLLVFSAPAVIVARRIGQPKMAKHFLVAAGVCGLICGVLSAGSERLIDRCQAAGNPDCLDSGTVGLQLMIVAGYLITSVVRSYLVAND